jgi:hypothetical protein
VLLVELLYRWLVFVEFQCHVLTNTPNQPIVAVQNKLPQSQNSVGVSLLVFCQTFGGAIFLAFAQTIFSHGLDSGLAKYAPTVNAESVIEAGATAIRHVVTSEQLPGVLEAYSVAVDHAFYLSTACASAWFCFSWGMGWYSVKKKKVEEVATNVAVAEV